MTQTNNSTTQPQFSLSKRMLVGAGIGLLAISVFVFSPGEPHPEWGKFWMIRPLMVTPLAGATGGACSYFIMQFSRRNAVNTAIAIILSAVVFIIGLWLGIVLGLAGTMWN